MPVGAALNTGILSSLSPPVKTEALTFVVPAVNPSASETYAEPLKIFSPSAPLAA